MKWMMVVKNVSDFANMKFLDVFELTIYEFFNIMMCLKNYNKEMEKKYKKNGTD